MTIRNIAAAAALAALAACGKGAGAGIGCPGEPEAHASIQKHIEKNVWSETERYIWKVKDISDFKFGPMKTGHIVQKQVEYGKNAQDVCPVRVDFTYKIAHMDGRIEDKSNADTTYLFYKNGFDEWVWKTE